MENLEITQALLEEFIRDKQVKKLRELFDEFNIVDLTDVVNELTLSEILFLFKILRKDVSGALFSYLSVDHQQGIIEAFTNNEIQAILESVYSDDIVDFITDMPANVVKKILQAATKEQREEINTLLSYPENSAGSLMSTEYVELEDTDTIGEAVKKIKRQGKVAETISYCYVINAKRRLVGTIALKDILFEPVNDLIADHMDSDIVYVETIDDQEEVARVISKYDILVVPVVNDQKCLIGIITVDDIIDVIQDEVTEDIQKMAAIVPVEDSYLNTSVFKMAVSRIPWLLALMITATLTGGILGKFEDALAVIPALASFVPMIMGTAGNAGSQASVMVIRGIAVDGLNIKDIGTILFKELKVGLICGAVLFVIVVLRIMFLPPSVSIDVALVVATSTIVAMILSKLMGGLLPLLALALKQDPAAMAAPLITTIVDTLSLLVYFYLCVKFLGI